MQPDSCLPNITGHPVRLLCFRPQSSTARHFFNTKTFHCRLSRSRRRPHCFLSFSFPASYRSCFNCCFPTLLVCCRSHSQWQRHCSTAASVPNCQLSATRLTSSPMSVPKAICPISTSFKSEVMKKSVLVINLQPTTNGISAMISVACFRSECVRRNPRKPPNERRPLRLPRNSKRRAQRIRGSLHWKTNLLEWILGSNRLLLQDRQGGRRSLPAASCSPMMIATSIRVQSSSTRTCL